MTTRMARTLRYWCPVAFWLALIMLESTELLSASHTGGVLYAVLTALFGHVDRAGFEIFHALLRKTGHFLGYGVLCALTFRAVRGTVQGTVLRWSLLALAGTALVACADELHQAFLPGRTGRVHDVVLDTVGALCVLLVFQRWQRRTAAIPESMNAG